MKRNNMFEDVESLYGRAQERQDYLKLLRDNVMYQVRMAMFTGFVYGALSAFLVVLLLVMVMW